MRYTVKRFSSRNQRRERDPLPTRFIDLPKFRGIEDKFWEIEYSSKVKEQLSSGKLDQALRKRVKDLKKSLKGGFVYSDNPDNKGENTHYLSDFSSPGKYHRLTKDINIAHRFDYIVYPPEIYSMSEDGRKILVSRVVVQSVVGHFDWRNERFYSEDNVI